MSVNGSRTRTFSWQDPTPSAALSRERSGIEVLQAVIDGALPPPPIADLLGMEMVEEVYGMQGLVNSVRIITLGLYISHRSHLNILRSRYQLQ